MKNILLVDDDLEVSRSIASLFDSAEFHVTHIDSGEGAENFFRQNGEVDVVMLDVNLPSMSGLELLKKIRKRNESLPVIVISGNVSTDNAIEAMREGAFEYLPKPFEIGRLIGAVNRACGIDRSKDSSQPAAAGDEQSFETPTDEIVGRSPEIVEIAKLIGQIASSDTPVLIFGETGTGKELVARMIHSNSTRRQGPFLSVNCSSLADTLLESEVFGHEKGAFTGAYYKRIGKFEQANKGSLFFDEVGDLSLTMQAKLLRASEDSTFERLGGTEQAKADTRIIAATNKSLVQAIKDGSFRVDLFYRLKIVSVYMPALRDRRGDVKLLTDHFIEKFSRELGKAPLRVNDEARALLDKYSWPGNVRELENNIHTALVMAKGSEICPEDLPIQAEAGAQVEFDETALQDGHVDLFKNIIDTLLPKLTASSEGKIYNFLHSAMERSLISAALKMYSSNQVKTSEALGISRNTLRDRIARYNLY